MIRAAAGDRPAFAAIVDRYGSFVLHRKGREDLIAPVTAARRNEVTA